MAHRHSSLLFASALFAVINTQPRSEAAGISAASLSNPSLSAAANPAAVASAPWPVATSLKSTLRAWASRQGWPAPRFLTEADWQVEVPGSIRGSIEQALKVLAEGFGKSPTRPRIEVSGNHVILVTEVGTE